ncbi:DegT/DnrJ/EryC1/StrS family aminotransferase [Thermococcus thioreducens]|uniref:Aminotransferase DegT n=1 Tax=Thermococcus thioreducens TaxID=277988 RepID=A0A0Q2M5W8_9EURY|nr:DegT/DnrJ/EryC1/StrS family aminotransferase [Thermococcus thioreducens]ASJ11448.1 aminotransferase DegT [Thermococcus thioreducens]KQH83465.1 aminotransferase DegT [Thermococcus thioreducens]SEW06529.1 perosamine synthetase [Thermococcus thioreducens]
MNIPLFKIYWDEDDIKAVEEVIRSGMHWCIGRQIEEFEKGICEYLGTKHCVAFNSGGSALHALMLAYGFKPGDEIIVPSFTFIATAYAPLYIGAKPIFADIEEETLGLDPEDVKEKITPKTKAIIAVHYGGMPCKVRELKEIAEDYGLILIEDAAEAFGAKVGGRYVGTFGDSAIFSFCQNKIFTTSEGGAVVTENEEIHRRLKLLVSYGRVTEGNYFTSGARSDYVEIGYNWRLSTILAALGLSQLKKVDRLIEMRRKNAHFMNTTLKRVNGIKVMEEPRDYFAVYQLYTIRVLEGEKTRNKLMDYLAQKGISTKIYFEPVHKYTVFRNLGYSQLNLPVTESISSQVLTLPLYPHMTVKELEYVASSVKEFMMRGDTHETGYF